jgi:hypothetical protein
MNKNIYLLKKCLYKYKYILLAVLVLLSFFYFFTPVVEEMTSSGMYDYLAPPPPTNTWSDATFKAIIPVINSNTCPKGTGEGCIPPNFTVNDEQKKMIYQFATEAEAKYYIQNKKWPYCQYIIDYVNKNPDLFKLAGAKDPSGKDMTLTTTQQIVPNRLFYAVYIGQKESQMSPAPLSYQIFMGTSKSPSSSSSAFSSETNKQISSWQKADPGAVNLMSR